MTEHDHEWVADGETWCQADHHDSCDYPDADSAEERLKAMNNCECERYRVRRYTCHCGEMKEVEYR